MPIVVDGCRRCQRQIAFYWRCGCGSRLDECSPTESFERRTQQCRTDADGDDATLALDRLTPYGGACLTALDGWSLGAWRSGPYRASSAPGVVERPCEFALAPERPAS